MNMFGFVIRLCLPGDNELLDARHGELDFNGSPIAISKDYNIIYCTHLDGGIHYSKTIMNFIEVLLRQINDYDG